MKSLKYKTVLQQGQSDCGVACLLSVINFYGGDNTLENLRRLSGTTITGTTLLGLYQSAKQCGFDAEGFEATVDALIEHGKPCILNVLKEKKMTHYIVFWGILIQNNKQVFLIGDPAKGTETIDRQTLDEMWHSKACLTIEPNHNFVRPQNQKSEKKKWIKELIREDTPLLVIALFLGIVIAGLGLTMAIFSQRLIDDILPQKNYTKLLLGISLVLFLLIAKEGITVLRQYFLLRQSKDFNIRLSIFFYNHLLSLPKPFFDTRKIGELTTRLNDTSRIQRVITQLTGNLIIDSLAVVVSAVFIFLYSPGAGFICLLSLPVFYLLARRHTGKIKSGQQSIMSSYAMTEANYISTLQGVEAIKNSNKEGVFAETNRSVFQIFQQNIFSLGRVQLKLSFLANLFGAIFLTSILLYTSYQVLDARMKTGELIAILGMCGSLLPGVANIALISIPISEAKIAFDRMFEFTNIESEKSETGKDIYEFNQLRITNLSFRFTGRPLILNSVSFEFGKGSAIAIVGENGCGKSTLSQIIQKHYHSESGSIMINESLDLQEVCTADWRKMVGVVPQHIHIFNGTVLENIAFEDAADNPQKVLSFLEKYELVNYIDSLPQSFLTIVGEEGINLSGGQKQIIALARALYKAPQLLILDEATAAMDRNSEMMVIKLLNKIKKDIAVIFITHRLHRLKSFCDFIYILDNGNVSAYGSHDELMKTSNLYSDYFNNYAGN